MKTRIQTIFIALATGIILADPATGQTFTTLYSLHSFSALAQSFPTNSDGANPWAGLVVSGDTLYGAARYGGGAGSGTIFKVNTNGAGFGLLHDFSAVPPYPGPYTNSDGANPWGSLVMSGNTFYGTAIWGGDAGYGTVFKVNDDGTDFTVLHSFTTPDASTGANSDGAWPESGLILSGNMLYGTAKKGGSEGGGTVFRISTNGTAFAVLHNFPALPASPPFTNSEGADPVSGLVLSGANLYGTAVYGGNGGGGTIFKVGTNGTGFEVLHTFTARDPVTGTNSDGAIPAASLIVSGDTLYGTAEDGGSGGSGTVFGIGTNGSNFRVLHGLSATDPVSGTNNDGAIPSGSLALSGSTLYGTTESSGGGGNGTVFQVQTNGTGFTVLHTFTSLDPITATNIDGANPNAGLILSGGILYGTTGNGGNGGAGIVFALSLASPAPAPTISSSAYLPGGQFQMLLTGIAGQNYTLQMSTNLASNNWTALLVTNNPATNSFIIADPNATNRQRFYRVLVGP